MSRIVSALDRLSVSQSRSIPLTSVYVTFP